MRVTFRPIDRWPGELHRFQRTSQFSAGFSNTLNTLERELSHLGAHAVVIQVAMTEADIRLDGWPRSGARATHPGVIVAFDSRYGPLKYATDTFSTWQDNLRAIALGLEALRKVDRYGITKRGEQYAGWRQLEAGGMTFAEARALIDEYGGEAEALKATHPDRGGDRDDFERVQQARELIA